MNNDIPTIYRSFDESLYNADTITINGTEVDNMGLHANFEPYSRGASSFTGCEIEVTTNNPDVCLELTNIGSLTVCTDETKWEMDIWGDVTIEFEVGKAVPKNNPKLSIANLRKIE